jgi:hypothetical protein
VDDQRQQHDEHDKADQPDDEKQPDMLDRGQETVVLEDLDEVVDADERTPFREREVDRVERGQHAEGEKEQRVRRDERKADPALRPLYATVPR